MGKADGERILSAFSFCFKKCGKAVKVPESGGAVKNTAGLCCGKTAGAGAAVLFRQHHRAPAQGKGFLRGVLA